MLFLIKFISSFGTIKIDVSLVMDEVGKFTDHVYNILQLLLDLYGHNTGRYLDTCRYMYRDL